MMDSPTVPSKKKVELRQTDPEWKRAQDDSMQEMALQDHETYSLGFLEYGKVLHFWSSMVLISQGCMASKANCQMAESTALNVATPAHSHFDHVSTL